MELFAVFALIFVKARESLRGLPFEEASRLEQIFRRNCHGFTDALWDDASLPDFQDLTLTPSRRVKNKKAPL